MVRDAGFVPRKEDTGQGREREIRFSHSNQVWSHKKLLVGGKGKDHAEGFFPSFPLSALGGGNGVSRHKE